jgi:hypothetical protein
MQRAPDDGLPPGIFRQHTTTNWTLIFPLLTNALEALNTPKGC